MAGQPSEIPTATDRGATRLHLTAKKNWPRTARQRPEAKEKEISVMSVSSVAPCCNTISAWRPAAGEQATNLANWRKAILLNRSALLAAWPRHFPQHDFVTLRLVRSPLAWDDDAWARAARSYHEDRRRGRL
jgi:hypothetical protein